MESAALDAASSSDLDDKVFTPLSQVLSRADEVILGETVAVSEDNKRLTVRILRTGKDALPASEALTIPHPRLTTNEGFVDFRRQSQYVYILMFDADGAWRTPEFGQESVFPIENDQVLIPPFYIPGAALPAKGPSAPVQLDTFFSAVRSCDANDHAVCRETITKMISGLSE